MDGIIGVGIALAVMAVAARIAIREAVPNGSHRAGARRSASSSAPERPPPAAPRVVAPEPRPQAAEVPPTPTREERPTAASDRVIASRPIPSVSKPTESSNGVVVTAFAPLVKRPSRPTPPAEPVSGPAPVAVARTASVDLIPAARVEVVDLDLRPGLERPALQPDPNRLIQTQVAVDASLGARLFAFLKLLIGVLLFGVLFGVGVISAVRGIVLFFQRVF